MIMVKKKKPNFNVINYGKKKRVKSRWRKPRGIDNKKRIRVKEFGATPKVGYKKGKERGTHRLGLKEFLINNVNELVERAKEAKEKWLVRISGKVNKRNKEIIRKKAKDIGLRTLN